MAAPHLRLTRRQRTLLEHWSREGLPEEACGLLVGRAHVLDPRDRVTQDVFVAMDRVVLEPHQTQLREELVGEPRKMGGGDRHLSFTVKQHRNSFRAVAFGKGEWADELAQTKGNISICFAPIINEFRGRSSVELRLIDWQPASAS